MNIKKKLSELKELPSQPFELTISENGLKKNKSLLNEISKHYIVLKLNKDLKSEKNPDLNAYTTNLEQTITLNLYPKIAKSL